MGFQKIGSDKIDTIFKRFSVALRMSTTQFSTSCRELNLNLPFLGSPEAPVTKFFNLFKENTSFNQRQLSCLGVLLGNGSAREKSRVLFKIYDSIKDNMLDEEEIRTMIDDVLFVALIALPKLAVFSLKDADKIDDIEKFNRKLKGAFATVRNYFEIIILSSQKREESFEKSRNKDDTPTGDNKKKRGRKSKPISITFQEFLEKFESQPMQIFCDASLLRHFAAQKYSQVIAPRDLVKDYLLETLPVKK
jgi:hypothetical protein